MHSKSEDQKEDTTVLVQYLPFFSLRLLGASLCSSFVADIGTMSSDDEDGYRVNAFKGNTSGDSDSSDMDSDDDMANAATHIMLHCVPSLPVDIVNVATSLPSAFLFTLISQRILCFDTTTLVAQPFRSGTTQAVPFRRKVQAEGSPIRTSSTVAVPFADFALPAGWRGQHGGGGPTPAMNVASDMHGA